MKRFEAVWQETWWLWIGLAVFGLAMSLVHPSFLSVFPISAFVFLYFAFMRYDENGNVVSLGSSEESKPDDAKSGSAASNEGQDPGNSPDNGRSTNSRMG